MIRTGRAELAELWRRLGIRQGMIVLCHSFLGALGRVDGGADAVIDSLLEVVGAEGTLVVPAFTYSFFKDEIFDVEATPSTVGVLGDVLRRRPNATRSLDPNFSNVALGRLAAPLMHRSSNASFGADSFYDRFLRQDGHILLVGVDYTALPLFMHLEWRLRVPYRYEKSFEGSVRIGVEERRDTAVHFVRDERTDPQTDRRRIGAVIDEDGAVQRADCAYGVVRSLPARAVERVVGRELRRDPLFLLRADRPFRAIRDS
jgi:aminoglycoside 3-N-acetyltransferase